eukprot:198895_1
MVHALCKEADEPYLFLQLENQTDEVKIINESYNKLQEIYEALCEGQKLNPCEDDGDGGDAFIDKDEKINIVTPQNNDNDNDKKMKEWENKFEISDSYLNLVNNSG